MCKSQGACAEVLTEIYSRLPAFSRPIKRVFKVYVRTLEFHRTGTKKNCVKVKFLSIIAATTERFYG